MAENRTCVSCGAEGTSGINDKLKFKNKKGGSVYIHYKADGENGMLCRKCWLKNLKQFHDKIERGLNSEETPA